MTIDRPGADQLPALKRLWQQAFGDPDAVVDAFFSTAFSHDRCLCVLQDTVPAACAYWLDGILDGQKIAYIYAVATQSASRGQGLCHRLMETLHKTLAARDYAAAVLMPGTKDLFRLYAGMGYVPCSSVTEFTCPAVGEPARLCEITGEEYARLRPAFLPEHSVIQTGPTLAYLASYCRFYAGDGILLCGMVEDGVFHVQEFLGSRDAAPGIVKTLGAVEGRFRMPGPGREYAMFLPLTHDCPTPAYLGLPLD